MSARSQRPTGRSGAISSLDTAINVLYLAREVSSVTPAKAVFGSVGALLTMIKVCPPSFTVKRSRFTCTQGSMVNELDYVELGLFCADICRALDRGTNGKRLDEFTQSVRDAIGQLKT
jgi:hypothetical protein